MKFRVHTQDGVYEVEAPDAKQARAPFDKAGLRVKKVKAAEPKNKGK